jgi:hypothetical protein
MNHRSHPLSAALCCGLAATHGSIAFGRNRRMSRTPSRSDPLVVLLTPSTNTAYCLNVKLQPLRKGRRKAFRHGAHPGERQPRRSKSSAPAVDLAPRRAGIKPRSMPGPETCRILSPSRPTKGAVARHRAAGQESGVRSEQSSRAGMAEGPRPGEARSCPTLKAWRGTLKRTARGVRRRQASPLRHSTSTFDMAARGRRNRTPRTPWARARLQNLAAEAGGAIGLARAFSSEVDTGSREENAIKQRSRILPRFEELRNCSSARPLAPSARPSRRSSCSVRRCCRR